MREWIFCDHCQKKVSHATFYRHKRLNQGEGYEQHLSSDSNSEELSEDESLSDLSINDDDNYFPGDHNTSFENDCNNGSEEVYKADLQVHFDCKNHI